MATGERSKSPSEDVLDVLGAAELLRVGRNKVYELVGGNKIPHRRLGRHIRFSRTALLRWLDSFVESKVSGTGRG
jgi:excisionase family DNA binding protein